MRFLPTPLVQRSLGILGMAAILLVGCTSARPVTAPVQVPTTEAREQVQPPAPAAPPATVVTPVQAPSAYEKERDRLVAQLDNPAFWERLAYDSSRQMRSAAVGWAAERALLLNPASVPALRARARHCLYHWTCTPGDAVSALEQAQAIAPKEVDVTMELARAYVLTRQPQKALALYDQMVAISHPAAGGARRSADPATASDLTGDGKPEIVQVAGSTVQVQGGDGQSLLTFEVPGTEQHLEAEIVYLGDLLPSLLVTRANDDRRGDYVFAWSAREGRLAEVYREVSRGGYYDPFLAVLVKTMRIGPAYDSGVKWSLPEGKMTKVGGVALLGTGNLRRAITVNHLAALLGWELGAPDNPPAWADEPAWRALVEGLKPYLAGGGLGCFLLEAGSEEQYLLVVVQRGKVILTADAALLQLPDGVRLRSVTGITLRK